MDIKEQIKVMQAFADGRKIEIREGKRSDWIPCHSPVWNWFQFDYRISPEPPIKKLLWGLINKRTNEITFGSWQDSEVVAKNTCKKWNDLYPDTYRAIQLELTEVKEDAA